MKNRFAIRVRLVASLVLVSFVCMCRAQQLTRYTALADFDSVALSKTKAGYRIAGLTSYLFNDKEVYAAIWNKTAEPGMIPHLSMDEKAFEKIVKEMEEKGYRPGHSSVVIVNGAVKYSVIFLKTSADWIVKNKLSKEDFNKEQEKNEKRGYGLVDICSYETNEEKFLGVWEKGKRSNVKTRAFSTTFEKEITSQWYKDYVPVRITRFNSGSASYSGIFMEDTEPHYTLLGIEGYRLEAEAKHAASNGVAIKSVNAITKEGTAYFDAVFEGKSSNSLKEVLRKISVDAWHGRMGFDYKAMEPVKEAMDALTNERCCNNIPEFWFQKWEVYSSMVHFKELNLKYPAAAYDAAYAMINYRLIADDNSEIKKSGSYDFIEVYNLLKHDTYGLLKEKEYAKAFKYAKGLVELSDVLIENKWIDDKFDTTANYLAGYAGRFADDESCVEFYLAIADREIADEKYADVYGFLASYHSLVEDEENYKKYLSLGRKLFPALSKEWDEMQAKHIAK